MTMSLTVGPADGSLTLRTGRAGVAAKAGHDLTLTVRDWSAQATLDAAGELVGLVVTAALSSLEVTKGEGGLKPLSDKDKVTILEQAAKTLKADRHPAVTFTMTSVSGPADRLQVSGTTGLAGSSQPTEAVVTISRDGRAAHIVGRADLVQSAFGIKPYVGMLGALKVRDAVEVHVDVHAVISD